MTLNDWMNVALGGGISTLCLLAGYLLRGHKISNSVGIAAGTGAVLEAVANMVKDRDSKSAVSGDLLALATGLKTLYTACSDAGVINLQHLPQAAAIYKESKDSATDAPVVGTTAVSSATKTHIAADIAAALSQTESAGIGTHITTGVK